MTHPIKPIPSRDLLVVPKFLGLIFLILLALGLIINITLGVKKIILPPELILESPQNGALMRDPVVEVRGRTEPGSLLSLNNQTIITTYDGLFRELLPLQNGLNRINISARKRYSRPKNLELRIIYEPAKELTYNPLTR